MSIKIALAGNPNSGKTTLFNALTGTNQFVGNWPGVTVEKKEGKLKWNKDVHVIDLPGIYSLSPYSPEEVVSREYLIEEKPDVILNVIDGSNLERNLYLTTQLLELGIPVVAAINMIDVVAKRGDAIDCQKLEELLGCPVAQISALKGTGVKEAADKAVKVSQSKTNASFFKFGSAIEQTLQLIENEIGSSAVGKAKRWFAVKLFEHDKKAAQILNIPENVQNKIETLVGQYEKTADDDSESIIASERYTVISDVLKHCYKKQSVGKLSVSDKIDKVLTNRILALPIFAAVMILVYSVAVSTVGKWATDWANEEIFGDGWLITGKGAYEDASAEYAKLTAEKEAYIEAAEQAGIDVEALNATLESEQPDAAVIEAFIQNAESKNLQASAEITNEDGEVEQTLTVTSTEFQAALSAEEPDPAAFGVFMPGIPVLVEKLLDALNVTEWLKSLILNGIVGGVGAVLGFVPQLLILFIFLAFLEACGYMARVAFIMDRIFRKFGLSGKSFIPMLISTGCGVPGIMASRTIENQKDRRMTIMTSTFMPCSAKLPIIALIAGALFNSAWWVAPSAYFVGIAAIVVSGIILKKTKLFSGEPAPFVMELPEYRLPALGNVLRSMWERASSFIKKAGSVILLSSVIIWILSRLGSVDGHFGYLEESQLEYSILAGFGRAIAWLFIPLGWADWRSAVATIAGLVAKENLVGTFGVLYNYAEVSEEGKEIWAQLASQYTTVAAYSLLVFNLLCAPCFAAIGAIKREMNNAKWTFIAIGYQTVLAYAAGLVIFQIGTLITTGAFNAATVIAFVLVIGFLYLLFRPLKQTGEKV